MVCPCPPSIDSTQPARPNLALAPFRAGGNMTVTTAAPAREASKAYRTELSPVSFLRRSACVYPDKVAVVHGDRRISYAELDQRVNRLASALILAGIAPGDRVAF